MVRVLKGGLGIGKGAKNVVDIEVVQARFLGGGEGRGGVARPYYKVSFLFCCWLWLWLQWLWSWL